MGGHGEREREPITGTGVWGGAPSGVQGQSPWWGSEGRSPPEAETLLAFGRSMEVANLPTFIKFGNAENHRPRVMFECLQAKCVL